MSHFSKNIIEICKHKSKDPLWAQAFNHEYAEIQKMYMLDGQFDDPFEFDGFTKCDIEIMLEYFFKRVDIQFKQLQWQQENDVPDNLNIMEEIMSSKLHDWDTERSPSFIMESFLSDHYSYLPDIPKLKDKILQD